MSFPHQAHSLSARWQATGFSELNGLPVQLAERASQLLNPFDQWCRRYERLAARMGKAVSLDERWLYQRAQWMNFHYQSNASANGSCHWLRCGNGELVLNLARPEDRELLPAWLQQELSQKLSLCDLAATLSDFDVDFLSQSAHLLGLPLALPGEVAPCFSEPTLDAISGHNPHRTLRVLDLSTLWAGPLCAQLLHQAGAQVTRVESLSRPDPVAQSCPPLFQQLHQGKQAAAIDFTTAAGRAQLLRWLESSDVLITSCRARAFAGLGLDLAEVQQSYPHLIWVAISAYSVTGGGAMRVGFGDDCAVAGGLSLRDGITGQRYFVGDAIADPLTGLRAAIAVLDAWCRGRCGLLDMALSQTAANVASMAGWAATGDSDER